MTTKSAHFDSTAIAHIERVITGRRGAISRMSLVTLRLYSRNFSNRNLVMDSYIPSNKLFLEQLKSL